MADKVAKLQAYIGADLNILISGPAGTGKTTMLKEACANLGLTLKYYSASTLDPFTDLVGLPVPQNDTKTVEYYRPHDLDQAEVVFMDELNRADPKTLNTVFELIQFKSINGEKLPKLRCVVAAINPNTDDYTVEDLDLALLDRFDMYLSAEPEINFAYFSKKYNAEVAKVVKTWWDDYHKAFKNQNRSSKNKVAYLSPRRMDIMVSAFQKVKTKDALADSKPTEAICDLNKLKTELDKAFGFVKPLPKVTTPRANVYANGAVGTPSAVTLKNLQRAEAMSEDELRKSANRGLVKSIYLDRSLTAQDRKALTAKMQKALATGLGPKTLMDNYAEVIAEMTKLEVQEMGSTWASGKYLKFWELKNAWDATAAAAAQAAPATPKGLTWEPSTNRFVYNN